MDRVFRLLFILVPFAVFCYYLITVRHYDEDSRIKFSLPRPAVMVDKATIPPQKSITVLRRQKVTAVLRPQNVTTTTDTRKAIPTKRPQNVTSKIPQKEITTISPQKVIVNIDPQKTLKPEQIQKLTNRSKTQSTVTITESREVTNTTKGTEKDFEAGYYREDTIPERMKSLPFLKNFKNPCWRELFANRSGTYIRCLPYFYLVGAPKCGTTDLNHRLIQHPLISDKTPKEPHWIARKRFLSSRNRNLSAYLNLYNAAVRDDVTKIQKKGYFNSIFGDYSASNLWDNKPLLRREVGTNFTIPSSTNAQVIHKLNNNTKIIIILREPITRLYSDFLYFHKESPIEDFVQRVHRAIDNHKDCVSRHNLRYCVYFPILTGLRIHIGYYYVYIEDYFKAFPREQIKILKLEDYSKDVPGTMQEIFKFLDVGIPTPKIMQQICTSTRANTNDRRKQIGAIPPGVYKLLKNFYKPFNDELVKLLGESFDYNKMTH